MMKLEKGIWYIFEERAVYEQGNYILKTLGNKTVEHCVPVLGGFKDTIKNIFIHKQIIVSIKLMED